MRIWRGRTRRDITECNRKSSAAGREAPPCVSDYTFVIYAEDKNGDYVTDNNGKQIFRSRTFTSGRIVENSVKTTVFNTGYAADHKSISVQWKPYEGAAGYKLKLYKGLQNGRFNGSTLPLDIEDGELNGKFVNSEPLQADFAGLESSADYTVLLYAVDDHSNNVIVESPDGSQGVFTVFRVRTDPKPIPLEIHTQSNNSSITVRWNEVDDSSIDKYIVRLYAATHDLDVNEVGELTGQT